ncbi:MAG: hypothetical protein IKU35_06555 [Bacteroidaceae bacterium]|nr:hypothetical protein [Bacteroidaceae bacterium]
MDGMLETTAICWDIEKHEAVHIMVGYYGSDCCNMCGGSYEIDATEEVKRDILRTLKRRAAESFARSVVEYKQEIRAGRTAVVARGRKVPKGTEVTVFWVGDRPTYRSRGYAWMNETERIAGCKDADGNKIWIKAEYLEATDILKSPSAKERKKFIKSWVQESAKAYNIHCKYWR